MSDFFYLPHMLNICNIIYFSIEKLPKANILVAIIQLLLNILNRISLTWKERKDSVASDLQIDTVIRLSFFLCRTLQIHYYFMGKRVAIINNSTIHKGIWKVIF